MLDVILSSQFSFHVDERVRQKSCQLTVQHPCVSISATDANSMKTYTQHIFLIISFRTTEIQLAVNLKIQHLVLQKNFS